MQRSSFYLTSRPLTAVLVDISESGARIATSLPRDIGMLLGVGMDLDGERVSVPILVRWERPLAEGGFESGGDFVEPTEAELRFIKRFVEHVKANPGAMNENVRISELLKPTIS